MNREPAADPRTEFVMSCEQELMTAVRGNAREEARHGAAIRFLNTMRSEAPALPGHHGFFNGYGRVYLDHGLHLEFAIAECESPYLVPLLLHSQQELARRAVARLETKGCSILLANNNHTGHFAATWGAHENYLVERSPQEFSAEILPFLVTRVFAGAGGVRPDGAFLAGVRPEFMELESGGHTTKSRAINSTCREEHLMGPRPQRFRYHLIVADGHRSHFNLALQLGSTALVLKAICLDPEFHRFFARLPPLPLDGSWVRTMKRLNRLAAPGEAPRVDPLVLDVQRIYLEAARHFAASLETPPAWIPRLLMDWQETLEAMERGEQEFLATRLDAFIKHRLYTEILGARGRSWAEVPATKDLFCSLALHDHSYHEFSSPESDFTRLEAAGVLDHRVAETVAPGEEPEPHVPATTTRARARARFIAKHSPGKEFLMDWSKVTRTTTGQRKSLNDPFSTAYGPWRGRRFSL